jgi:hypothetical protein
MRGWPTSFPNRCSEEDDVTGRRGAQDDNLRKQLDQRTQELAEALEQQLKIIHTRRSEQGIFGVAHKPCRPSSTRRRYDGRRSELV